MGEPWESIQADIEAKIQPGITHWQSPRYMAWFPAPVTYPSMLGELFSAAFTSANFNWICSPAVTELETIMMDWVARLLQLPPVFLSTSGPGGGGGCIQGTASEAVVACIVAARERYLHRATQHLPPDSEDKEEVIAALRGKLIIFSSEQAHSCTAKGARIAGVRYRSIKAGFGDDLAMTGNAVRKALEEARAKGLHPFFLTTSFGTTSTCAVDRLEEIAEVMKDWPEVWTYVDAAYAGVALSLPEYERFAKLVGHFDSFETNLHKWGLVNLDAACLFVRRRTDLTDAYSMTPSYLKNEMSEKGLVIDYRDWGIPLGRRFRSLKIWFVLRTYGTKGFRDLISSHIEMGNRFADLVRSRSEILEVITKPAFALTVLRCLPFPDAKRVGLDSNGTDMSSKDVANLQRANQITKKVYDEINRHSGFFITSTEINGVFALRINSANPNAQWKYLEEIFEAIVSATKKAIAGEAVGGVAEGVHSKLNEVANVVANGATNEVGLPTAP